MTIQKTVGTVWEKILEPPKIFLKCNFPIAQSEMIQYTSVLISTAGARDIPGVQKKI